MASNSAEIPAPDRHTLELFDLLSDGTRLMIVEALYRSDEPLCFSALYREIDADDGGRFNYHLDRLRGRLVEKGDDGYLLTQEGQRVAASLLVTDGTTA